MHDITGLLSSWRERDERALERLVPLVYDELRRVARRQLRGESPAVTIQPTALVHEVYLRLVDVRRATLTSRTHFFSVAAALMRRILVDQARRRHADNRGGGATMMHLDEVPPVAPTSTVDVLALDEALEALEALARIDPRPCRGAPVLCRADNSRDGGRVGGVAPTVEREWAFAKAWLLRRLSPTE